MFKLIGLLLLALAVQGATGEVPLPAQLPRALRLSSRHDAQVREGRGVTAQQSLQPAGRQRCGARPLVPPAGGQRCGVPSPRQ